MPTMTTTVIAHTQGETSMQEPPGTGCCQYRRSLPPLCRQPTAPGSGTRDDDADAWGYSPPASVQRVASVSMFPGAARPAVLPFLLLWVLCTWHTAAATGVERAAQSRRAAGQLTGRLLFGRAA